MEHKYYIGVDEVGRGPIAGPVTVCALVSFDGRYLEKFEGIKDSKKLSPQKRKEWYKKMYDCKKDGLIDFKVFSVSNKVIDKIGIVRCLKRLVDSCLCKLNCPQSECMILLDGSLKAPEHYKRQETITKGDEKEQLIAMASVVAKVHRDSFMIKIAQKIPNYCFERHKGYGTKEHYSAISKFGICDLHRLTFLKRHIRIRA